MEKITRCRKVTAPGGTKSRISRCTDPQVLPVIICTHIHNLNLSIQQTFASIVEHVERLKENVEKTNVHSGALFDSLMHKAFSGELVR